MHNNEGAHHLMNVAICGFGLMGQTHAHCYVRHPNTKLIAIADMDSSRLHMDFVDISSIRCYSDIDALLKDADVDVVSVCAPTPWHAPMVTRALAAGKYVLCEKPMAANLQDVESILSASRSAMRLHHFYPCPCRDTAWTLRSLCNAVVDPLGACAVNELSAHSHHRLDDKRFGRCDRRIVIAATQPCWIRS